MLKRFTAVLLGMLLLFSFGCANAETYLMAGYDGESSAAHDWDSNDFFVRMAKRTGTDFIFSEYTERDAWNAAKAQMRNGENLPDVLFKAALTTVEAIEFDENGILIDLLPLLPQYAPNLWALLQEHPDWLEAITLPSGHVVALPTINELPIQNAMWINTEWLNAVHAEMPTTLDELHHVLTLFKTRDANKNGRNDEIPFTFCGAWDLKFLAHAYGVAPNDYNLYEDESGNLRFWPLEDSFFDLANTLHSWYEEGLLDVSGFANSDLLRRITDDEKAVPYGLFFSPTPMSVVTYNMSSQFGVLQPLTANGMQVYRETGRVVNGGAFAITRACENPGELLAWVDVLYSEEGAIEAMVGYEEESWEWLDEEEDDSATRTWNWINTDGSMMSAAISTLTLYDTGTMPWRYPLTFGSNFFEETSQRINRELMQLQTYIKPATQQARPLGENREALLAVQNRLGAYVDTVFAQIILGEVTLTEKVIEEIREQFHQLGCDELIRQYKTAQQNGRR